MGKVDTAAALPGGVTPKEQVEQLLKELPPDSTYEEILREFLFARMIEEGWADSEAGRTISDEEMGRRIDSWAE